MDPKTYSVILQRLSLAGTNSACTGFIDVLIALPSRVVVTADVGADSYGDELHGCLMSTFRSMAQATEACSGPGFLQCWATQTAAANNLLVVVAGQKPPSRSLVSAVDEWRRAGLTTIGVVPWGNDPRSVLPPAMATEVSLFWTGTPCQVLDEILELALLTREHRRVFVSYAHNDGQSLAEEVFEEMSQRRFDVYLDRFRTPPGSDFLERIEDELIDKAMVVVVETPGALGSAWVRHEVISALNRRLGLAALNPGKGRGFDFIAEAFRHRLSAPLNRAALAAFIIKQHREALMRQKLTLLRSIEREFSAGAPPANIQVHGSGCHIDLSSTPPRSYEVGLSTRIATLHSMRLTDERAHAKAAKPVIIHRRPYSPARRADLDWMIDQADAVQVDIGLLHSFAQRAKAGTL